jgi:hypothetical protein
LQEVTVGAWDNASNNGTNGPTCPVVVARVAPVTDVRVELAGCRIRRSPFVA